MTSVSASSASRRYQERVQRLERVHGDVQRRWSLVANGRLLLFVVLVVTAWQWYAGRSDVLLWVMALLVAVLLPVIVYHRRLRARRDRLARLVEINRRGRDRAALHWSSAIPSSPLASPEPDHPYARDLNITGDESILRRIGTPVTVSGWRVLQEWVLSSGDVGEIARRQDAVRELADSIDLRQDVEQAGIDLDADSDDLERLLVWAEASSVIAGRTWMIALAWVGPLAALLLVSAQIAGVVSQPLWVLALAFNLIISQIVGAAAVADVQQVGRAADSLRGYRVISAVLHTYRPEAPLLFAIHSALDEDEGDAVGSIRRLSRAMSFIMPSGSLMYIPLQLAFCWDIHIAAALDRWKMRSGDDLGGWLRLLGEWEALAALSVLAWDHPDWVMPKVSADQDRIEAGGLRHPLLEEHLSVSNDTEVGPVGTFLFVTGSNMSGKSTLLRAIGANVVLAQAGAPVAAARMSLPLLAIVTTMRVEDSLAHGVSFFLAELQRLKKVVDAADHAAERPVLYLLDEILQGTNTTERQLASRRVLQHLVATNSIGAVSSHDLTLIEDSRLEDAAVLVHFSEQFDGDSDEAAMTFDYRLRPGLATSSNALRLMEMLGFPEH